MRLFKLHPAARVNSDHPASHGSDPNFASAGPTSGQDADTDVRTRPASRGPTLGSTQSAAQQPQRRQSSSGRRAGTSGVGDIPAELSGLLHLPSEPFHTGSVKCCGQAGAEVSRRSGRATPWVGKTGTGVPRSGCGNPARTTDISIPDGGSPRACKRRSRRASCAAQLAPHPTREEAP